MQNQINLNDIGKTVSFDVYPTATLGTSFKRVKLVAILDSETAGHFINVPVLAANVYPSLPKGTLKDYTEYMFLKLILQDGTATAVAVPWIDMSTWEIHSHVNVHFTVENASINDAERIRKVLTANGFDTVNYYID